MDTGSFRMRATARADESQYARIVELVRTAQASKAPLQRLADRYAVWFTPITVAVCAIAVWHHARLDARARDSRRGDALSADSRDTGGDHRRNQSRREALRDHPAWRRARATRRGGHGGVRQDGHDHHRQAAPPAGRRRAVVRSRHGAAATPRRSKSARATCSRACSWTRSRRRDSTVPASTNHVETPGQGIAGVVDGHDVRVGARSFILPGCDDGVGMADVIEQPGSTLRAYVSVDHKLAAVLEYADEVRPELPERARGGSQRTACGASYCCRATTRRSRAKSRPPWASPRRTAICCRATRRSSSSAFARRARR